MEFQALLRSRSERQLSVARCQLSAASWAKSAFNYWQQAPSAAPAAHAAPADSGSKQSDGWSNFFGGWQQQNLAAQINHNFGGTATAAGALPSSWTKCCQPRHAH